MVYTVKIRTVFDDLLESSKYPLQQILGVPKHTVFVDIEDELRCLYCNNLLSFYWDNRWYTYVLNDPKSADIAELKIMKSDNYIQVDVDTDLLESRSVANIAKQIRRRY